jgi:hypothetical protein
VLLEDSEATECLATVLQDLEEPGKESDDEQTSRLRKPDCEARGPLVQTVRPCCTRGCHNPRQVAKTSGIVKSYCAGCNCRTSRECRNRKRAAKPVQAVLY